MNTASAAQHCATWDFSFMLEVTIDRSSKSIWAYLIGDKKDIWTKSSYSTIAGVSGEVGEIYTHAHKPYGCEWFYETIEVNPAKYHVLKITYQEENSDESKLAGFDFFTLREAAGRTTLVFQQAFSLPKKLSSSEIEWETEQHKRRLTEIFGNLKTAVENNDTGKSSDESGL